MMSSLSKHIIGITFSTYSRTIYITVYKVDHSSNNQEYSVTRIFIKEQMRSYIALISYVCIACMQIEFGQTSKQNVSEQTSKQNVSKQPYDINWSFV